MSVKFHAWVIHDYSNLDSLQLVQQDIPEPPSGKLLVKMECSTINASDLISLRGGYYQESAPINAGLKGSGTVIKSGGGELADSLVSKRVCFATNGTWAEYAIVNANVAFPLEDHITFEQGTSICFNPLTVMNIIEYVQKDNHKAFMHNAAASALGLQLVRYTKTLGIPLINIVRREDQAQLLRSSGAEHVLITSEPDWKEKARILSNELGASVGFDAIGGEDTTDMAELLQDRGIVYSYGNISGKSPAIPTFQLIFKFKKLEGLYVIPWFLEKDAEERSRILKFIQNNMDIFGTHYNKEIDLNGVKEALESYRQKSTQNKILIRTRV